MNISQDGKKNPTRTITHLGDSERTEKAEDNEQDKKKVREFSNTLARNTETENSRTCTDDNHFNQ